MKARPDSSMAASPRTTKAPDRLRRRSSHRTPAGISLGRTGEHPMSEVEPSANIAPADSTVRLVINAGRDCGSMASSCRLQPVSVPCNGRLTE
ncbi:Uncharacterised protein [Mycobacteroides abscessus subsp. abscessus]|nr:Uncharacterised protein [Mycobacteroides abscessus subsp. abscessus]